MGVWLAGRGGACGLVCGRWRACVGSGGVDRPGARRGRLSAAPVLEAIAAQAAARAAEVAGWGLERSWPFSRLREAWVVARRGPLAAADAGPSAAGPLYPDDYARLRRAVARYERNQHGSAGGLPAGRAGRAAAHRRARRRRRAAGRAADVALRGRRAGSALAADAGARHRRQRRARPPGRRAGERRHEAPAGAAAHVPGRVAAVAAARRGRPAHVRPARDAALDPHARYVPPAGSDAYRMVVRDAYLLAGRLLPVDVDGRKQMALRHQRQIPPADRRPVLTDEQRELAELAHRTGEPSRLLARLSPEYRRAWLVAAASGGGRRRSRTCSRSKPGFEAKREHDSSTAGVVAAARAAVLSCRRVTIRRYAVVGAPGRCDGGSDRSRVAVACPSRPGARTAAPTPAAFRHAAAALGDATRRCRACSPRPRATCRIRRRRALRTGGCSRDDRAAHSDRARARAPDAPRPCWRGRWLRAATALRLARQSGDPLRAAPTR